MVKHGFLLPHMRGYPLAAKSAGRYKFENQDASDLVARFTVPPSNAQKALIDDLVGNLINTAGTWDKLDVLYIPSAGTQQAGLLNWKGNFNNLTPVNTTTFVANQGIAGDGVSGYFDSGLASNALPSMTQNSAHLAVWQLTEGITTDAGIGFGAAGNINVCQSRVRLYSSASAFPSNALESGYFVGRRDATNQQLFRNGAALAAPSAVVNAAITGTLTLSRFGNVYTTQRYAVAHAGVDLTDTEIADMYDAFRTYLVGMGTIPP